MLASFYGNVIDKIGYIRGSLEVGNSEERLVKYKIPIIK